jgi:hypothetical protein
MPAFVEDEPKYHMLQKVKNTLFNENRSIIF